MDNSPSILSLIPQRDPFVMVDQYSHGNDQLSRSTFRIRKDNILVENGCLTEAGLIENIAQTAAARVGYLSLQEGRPVPLGYIGSIHKVLIHALPKINDEIKTEVYIKNQIFNVTVVEGTIRSDDKLLAQCEMKIFIANQQ